MLYALMRFTTMTHFVVGPSDYPPYYRINKLIKNWYWQLFIGSLKRQRGQNTLGLQNVVHFHLFVFFVLKIQFVGDGTF